MISNSHIRKEGFTIVELLIVIVVIAILATISVVAYNGIQERANDTIVQNDLRDISKRMDMYKAVHDGWPVNSAEIGTLGIKVSKGSYGSGMVSNNYNILYCRYADGQGDVALVAASKSGKKYALYKGVMAEYTGRWSSNSLEACADVGIPISDFIDRYWFFENGSWKSFL